MYTEKTFLSKLHPSSPLHDVLTVVRVCTGCIPAAHAADLHSLLLCRRHAPLSVLLIRDAPVLMNILCRPIAGIVPAFAPFDADKLSRTRQQCEAHLRQLFEVGAEALLFRLDAPVLILPQVDIQLSAAVQGDLPLLEALAPAV